MLLDVLTLLSCTALLIFLSALCSGSEAAIFSIPEIKVRQMIIKKVPKAEDLLKVIENKDTYIGVIVCGNNIVNIMGATYIGTLAASTFGYNWVSAFSAVLTLAIIMFAEIIPKSLATRQSIPIALAAARPLIFIGMLLKPLITLINAAVNAIIGVGVKEAVTDEEEISHLVAAGAEEKIISRHEHDYIQNVFQLDDKTAKEISTSSTVMTKLNASMTLDEADEIIMSSEHSRIPVLGDDPNKIIGLILLVDILKVRGLHPGSTKISELDIIQDVLSLPETLKADALLRIFQRKQQHLAVIRDEYGLVTGLVTLEDVLEIIVGEIRDERDTIVDMQDRALEQARSLKTS